MGIASKLILISVLVLITSFYVHEYAPHYVVTLMNYPVVRYAVNSAHRLKNSYFSQSEEEPVNDSQEKLFTIEELNKYKGNEGDKGLYLAFMGEVYNVEKGRKFYQPGGGYGFFSGRDATRAFITGDFTEEGLIDDITGLTSSDYLGIEEWVRFYHKDYIPVGKLIGRYYDEKGKPTTYHKKAHQWLRDAVRQKEAEKQEKVLFPPCNSEWSPELGSRVYCTKKSGGIERDWIGVPRKLFTRGVKNERCACIKNFGAPSGNTSGNPGSNRGDLDNPQLKEYPGCDPEGESCNIPVK